MKLEINMIYLGLILSLIDSLRCIYFRYPIIKVVKGQGKKNLFDLSIIVDYF